MTTIAYLHAGMEFEYYLGSHIYSEIYRGIIDGCRDRGVRCDFFDARTPIAAWLRTKRFREYDGIIGTVPTALSAAAAAWRALERRHPCVNMMIASKTPQGNFAGTDDASGMRLIMEHLTREGHERIGYFGIADERYSRERFRGYCEFMLEKKMPLRQEWVHGFSITTGKPVRPLAQTLFYAGRPDPAFERAVKIHCERFLSMKELPTAVVFETDLAALMFTSAALVRGMRIPGDIAVAGYDNNKIMYPGSGRVQLTTVEQDFYTVGKAGVALLDEVIRDKQQKSKSVLIPPRLIVRESSLRRSLKRPRADAVFSEKVSAYIAGHYGDDNLSHALSAMLGMNHKYFFEKFAAVFGVYYVDYVNDIRLDKAAERLRTTGDDIVGILIDMGFGTHQNFTRLFKRKFGVTALRYRKQHTG
ncbi:MAG: substrate-binding domain-containing protein [Spirochaetes bacterium]|nr:substrate-binding domain-containing protein [Spirochaetota bacterium]